MLGKLVTKELIGLNRLKIWWAATTHYIGDSMVFGTGRGRNIPEPTGSGIPYPVTLLIEVS
jgi:hypothetical protein